MKPDLDRWLANPGLRVTHRRESSAAAEQLWDAALRVRLDDAGRLGRLIRWRIPGTSGGISFFELFRKPPFIELEGDVDQALVAGLVGRIWTLRRDYPVLEDPAQFRAWQTRGTARVVFGNWIEQAASGRSALVSETRVQALGTQGKVGVAAVRPLVSAFHSLVGSDGIEAAVRLAERQAVAAPSAARH
jgi:hypothetical protein